MIKKEIRALTGIRGIAAFYIVMFHYSYLNSSGIDPSTIIGHVWHRGYLAVDLFFVLSGFVITLSSVNAFDGNVTFENYKLFIKRRFTRIYPAYFVIFVLATIFIVHFFPRSSVFLSVFLLSIFSSKAQVLGVFWSLSVEWLTYLILPFWIMLLSYLGKARLSVLLLIFFISYGIIYINFYNTDQVANLYTAPFALLRGLGSYALGMFAFYSHKKIVSYPWLTDIFFLLILFCLAFLKLDLFVVLFTGLMIRNMATEQKSVISRLCSGKVIYWLGLVSYSLYLTHQFLMELSKRYFYNFLTDHFAIYLILMVTVSLIVAQAYYKFIELPLNTYISSKLRNNYQPIA